MSEDKLAGRDMTHNPVAEQRDITVLVVDDEPSNLSSLRKIFEREQMRVFTAEDNGEHTFDRGLILWQTGPQTISVTDLESSITGSASILVQRR